MSALLPVPAAAGPRSRRTTNIVIALISVVVMTLVVGYLVMPTRYAFALDSVGVTRIPANEAVVYGKITNAAGHAQPGFTITVSKPRKVHHHVKYVRVAQAKSNSKGLYRIVLHKVSGKYKVSVSGRVAGKVRTAAKVLTLRLKHAYRISAHVTKKHVFTFLPVSSY